MRRINRISDLLKGTVRSLNYHARMFFFEDYRRIQYIPQHLDIINLGSNPAKFDIDYSDSGYNGFSLAVGPQTLEYDFRILKNFHSFLDCKGPRICLLVLCPLSLCKYRYKQEDGEVHRDLRYYPILHHSQINNYSEAEYIKWVKRPLWQILKHPGLGRPFINFLRHRRVQNISVGASADCLRSSAEAMLNSWKREFGLTDFSGSNLPGEIKLNLSKNEAILNDIKQFCEERDIRPIVVLPPVSRHLTSHISDNFLEECLYSRISDKGIQTIDFMKHPEWSRDENFAKALYLHTRASKEFTKVLIERLKLNSQYVLA